MAKAPIKLVIEVKHLPAAPVVVADVAPSPAPSPPAPDPVMDAVARHNAHLAANPILRDRLEREAATQRAFDEQRARNHPKAAR